MKNAAPTPAKVVPFPILTKKAFCEAQDDDPIYNYVIPPTASFWLLSRLCALLIATRKYFQILIASGQLDYDGYQLCLAGIERVKPRLKEVNAALRRKRRNQKRKREGK
jgi:hypothetical protein